MHDLLTELGNWIASSRLSLLFQTTDGLIAASQSTHILAISVVFGSALMISLRLLGVGATGRTVSCLASSLLPWMYSALGVLLLTGLVQTIAEPIRQLLTPAFWWKMGMLICVIALTVWFGKTVRDRAEVWDDPASRPASARVFAVASLVLWVAIVVCGRLIAYTWQLQSS
ncbi:DUF6644 family protein [Burkholderia sp. MR1-5-21]